MIDQSVSQSDGVSDLETWRPWGVGASKVKGSSGFAVFLPVLYFVL